MDELDSSGVPASGSFPFGGSQVGAGGVHVRRAANGVFQQLVVDGADPPTDIDKRRILQPLGTDRL
ncbi:MAG TPA: hypothetical protein VMJ64_07970 [Anaerolineales bacterium]|nr:hypothetical protein [Anaerolineales bacterium]